MLRQPLIVALACAVVLTAAPGAIADPSSTPSPSPTSSSAAATNGSAPNPVRFTGRAAANPAGRAALEARLAQGMGKGGDRRGVLPSLYRGALFKKKHERIRRCIIKRESHANYRAVGGNGRWRGAYQMSRGLARGATHMMAPEVRKDFGPAGVAILKKLRATPINQWNRYWQDRAFWTIWRKGKGASHWSGMRCR